MTHVSHRRRALKVHPTDRRPAAQNAHTHTHAYTPHLWNAASSCIVARSSRASASFSASASKYPSSRSCLCVRLFHFMHVNRIDPIFGGRALVQTQVTQPTMVRSLPGSPRSAPPPPPAPPAARRRPCCVVCVCVTWNVSPIAASPHHMPAKQINKQTNTHLRALPLRARLVYSCCTPPPSCFLVVAAPVAVEVAPGTCVSSNGSSSSSSSSPSCPRRSFARDGMILARSLFC